MSETKLKCCPFCGGEVKAYADNHNKVMISCDNCNMYFGIELEIGCELEEGWKATHNSKEEAIKRWNTRKPMDNIVAELRKASRTMMPVIPTEEAIDIVERGGIPAAVQESESLKMIKCGEAVAKGIEAALSGYEALNVCEWKKLRDHFSTSCDYDVEEEWFPTMFSATLDEYHCPYCGKRIKAVR